MEPKEKKMHNKPQLQPSKRHSGRPSAVEYTDADFGDNTPAISISWRNVRGTYMKEEPIRLVLGIFSFQVITNISHRVVCVGRFNEHSDNEIHLLPTQVVGCPVRHIAFSNSNSASVFI